MLRNVACFPLKYGVHIIGVLELSNYHAPFEDNIGLVRSVCEQISAGLILYEMSLNFNVNAMKEEVRSVKTEYVEDLKILTKLMDCDL